MGKIVVQWVKQSRDDDRGQLAELVDMGKFDTEEQALRFIVKEGNHTQVYRISRILGTETVGTAKTRVVLFSPDPDDYEAPDPDDDEVTCSACGAVIGPDESECGSPYCPTKGPHLRCL